MQAPADGRTTMEYENFEDQEDILPSDRVKETEDKEEQFAKAEFSIVSTASGKIILTSEVQLKKACLPIALTLFGSVTFSRE